MTASGTMERLAIPELSVPETDQLEFAQPIHALRADHARHLQRTAAEAGAFHETSFFRGQEMFRELRETILPRLIAARAGERRLRIWSAAASTGQEAYSVALLLGEEFPDLAEWDVQIVGSDLVNEVVEAAARGRFQRREVNRGLPARLLLKHFTRNGEEWEIDEELRRRCEFLMEDLCAPPPALPQFDLVLLRNVLLQIPRQQLPGVFEKVRRQMADDGALVLGESEQAEDWTDLFHAKSAGRSWYYVPAESQKA